jgi:hypothetical protein
MNALALDTAPRVGHSRLDLEPVSHDSRISEQSFDALLRKTRNLFYIEISKGLAVPLTLVEDRRPAQTRLGALEHQEFKLHPVVVDGHAPFLVVVLDVIEAHASAATRAILGLCRAGRGVPRGK